MGWQIGCLLFLCACRLLCEDKVRINLVARSRASHRAVLIEAKDLQVHFDGAPQPISALEPLGCRENSLTTAAVILDSTQIGQGASSPGGAGYTESGARQTEARKVLERLRGDLVIEAYAWAPRLIPIRMLQENGGMEAFSLADALKIFDRRTVLTTGGVIAQNHLGSLARWSDMERLANHLASRPGRKSLIWYCTAASDNPVGLLEGRYGYDLWASALLAMNRENVAVYPIDCSISTPQSKPNYEKLIKSEPLVTGSKKLGTSSFSEQVIANYTGGRFYASMTKLETAIRDGLADSQCSYELTWGPLGRAGGRRTTRADSLIPEVYFEAPLPQSEAERLKIAEGGLIYRVPLSAIPVRGTWNGAQPQARYRTTTLTFIPDGNGTLHAEVDVIWAYYDTNGSRLKTGKHSVVRLTPSKGDLSAFQNKEQVIEGDLGSPPGAAELRILIRDSNSGKMGTAYLEIPSVNSP